MEKAKVACLNEEFGTAEEYFAKAKYEVKTNENPRYCPGPGCPGSFSGQIATLAAAYAHEKKYKRAEELFRLAISISPEEHYLSGLCELYEWQSNYEAALPLREKLEKNEQERNGANTSSVSGEQLKLAECHAALGNFSKAEHYYNDYIQSLEKSPYTGESLQDAYVELGDFYLANGKIIQAKNFYEKSLAVSKKLEEKDGLLDDVDSISGLASVASIQGNYEVAESLFERAINGKFSISENRKSKIYQEYSKVLKKLNRAKRSKSLELKMRDFARDQNPSFNAAIYK